MITAPQKNNQKRRQFCGIRRNAKKPLMKFHNIQKHPWVYITNIQKHKKKNWDKKMGQRQKHQL
jgi:hypothetical protein